MLGSLERDYFSSIEVHHAEFECEVAVGEGKSLEIDQDDETNLGLEEELQSIVFQAKTTSRQNNTNRGMRRLQVPRTFLEGIVPPLAFSYLQYHTGLETAS